LKQKEEMEALFGEIKTEEKEKEKEKMKSKQRKKSFNDSESELNNTNIKNNTGSSIDILLIYIIYF
jgi:hypothetical protein